MPNVLVVEKTDQIRNLLTQRFAADHISVESTALISAAGKQIRIKSYDILIWHAAASKTELAEGFELLDLLTKGSSKTFILLVAAQRSGSLRLDRLRACAHRTVSQPLDENEICSIVEEALRQQSARSGYGSHRDLSIPLEFEGMLGISLPMRQLFQRILEAASEDISVLITGETGTGKDMVAAAIHRRSRQASGPYVVVNTGAMPSELIASELFGHERGAVQAVS